MQDATGFPYEALGALDGRLRVLTGLVFEDSDLVRRVNAGELDLDTLMPGRGLGGVDPHRLTYRRLSYADLAASLRTRPPEQALVTVGPAPRPGRFSFGVQHGYLDDLLASDVPILALLNHGMPHVPGAPTVERDRVRVVTETDRLPIGPSTGPVSAPAARIGELVAALVPEGATLQLGLGSIAAAVAAALHRRRGLRLVSGLVGSWVLALRPALDRSGPAPPVTTTVLAGGADLLRAATGDGFVELAPASEAHDPARLCQIDRLVAVNGAVSVALDGSVNCERVGRRLVSGRGSHTDFCRAAHESSGGVSIVALPSRTARGEPRIVATHGDGDASTPGHLVDVVVTERGVADLRGTDPVSRARRIVEVAHPDDRLALDPDTSVSKSRWPLGDRRPGDGN